MIYGYIRVSTDKQSVDNQRYEIEQFCEKEGLKVDGWVEETISGTKAYDQRQLGQLLAHIGKGDLIVATELSRFGRDMYMIMQVLNICMEKQCKVITTKDNYRLGGDLESKILAFAFSLCAEVERRLISQRTKEALARKAAEGQALGRPKGFRARIETRKLHPMTGQIQALFAEGNSQRQVAKIIGVDRSTLSRFVKDVNINIYAKNVIIKK